jgi:hypothetical protein
MFLFAPWDLQEEGQSIQIQITGSNGINALYSKTTGSFFTAMSATIEDRTYNNFLLDFTNYLSSSALGTWNYRYSFASSSYIISCSSPSTGALLRFSPFAAQALGMANGTTSSQSSYVSSTGSMFTWDSTEDQWTNISYPYEGKTIVREQECDDGRVYALSNEDGYDWLSNIEGNYTWYDWQFAYETRENTFSDFSSSLAPNTYEEFLKQVRSYRPFVMFQPSSPVTKESGSYENRQGTYKIRADQSMFKAKPSIKNIDQYWTVDMQTRRLSQGNNFDSYQAPVLTSSFVPTQVSGCYLWLRADLGITLSASTTDIVSWQDQGPNRFVFTQSVVTKRPNLISSSTAYGTTPTVLFSRTTVDRLSTRLVPMNSPFLHVFIATGYNGAKGASLYTLCEIGENILSTATPDMTGTFRICMSGASPAAQIHAASRTISTAEVTSLQMRAPSQQMLINKPYATYVNFTGYVPNYPITTVAVNTSSLSISASSPNYYYVTTTGSTPTVYLTSASYLNLGARVSNLGLDGYITEMIMYTSNLSSTDKQNIANYFNARYGVTLAV